MIFFVSARNFKEFHTQNKHAFFVTDKNSGKVYIMMEASACALYKSEEEYEVLEK